MERVALITGGTGHLGRALVPRLAARGFRLAVTYFIPEEAAGFEEELDLGEDRMVLRRVDATDPADIGGFVTEVVERFGGLNVVAALVGGWAGGRDVEETDDVRFDRMLDLNLRSAFYTARAVIPHLKAADWGRLVLVGSRAAFDAPPGQAAFNVAKAGVVALTRTLAHELRDSAVTANTILPSIIDTPATRTMLPYADYVEWPKPEEIAAVVEFLALPESGVINGATLPAYGRA